MEAHEIAERIHEHAEHGAPGPRADILRRVTGVYVGIIAALLAIASLGSANATREMLNANIHASDTYAFYQSKYIRQIHYQTAAEELQLLAIGAPGLSADHLAKVDRLVKRYQSEAEHLESSPDKNNGKKELLAQAQSWEHDRDHAAAQIPNFEYAEGLLQIAIVLGSVAIVASSIWILGASGVLAVFGLLFFLNGYLLLVPLAHG